MRWILVAVVLAVVARGAVLAARWEALASDPDGYRALAETWATTGTFGYPATDGAARATAFRPPGYPWLLSWGVVDGRLSSAAVAVVHLIVGALAAVATGAVALRLGAAPVVAAALVALDPILLIQSTEPMTEPTAALVAVLAWLVWIAMVRVARGGVSDGEEGAVAPRRGTRGGGRLQSGDREGGGRWQRGPASAIGSAVGLGAVLSAAVFVRPTFLVWVGGLLLLLLIAGIRHRRMWLAALAVGAVVAAGIGGWMLRNRRAVGHPVWATTHGGYTLLLANNPMFYDHLRRGDRWRAWDAEPFFDRWSRRWGADPTEARFWDPEREPPRARPPAGIGEVEEDRRAAAAAKAAIRREPGMFLRGMVHGVGRLWSPLPLETPGGPGRIARGAVALWYLGVYALAALGLWRLGHRVGRVEWLAGLGIVATLSFVHAVYWSNMRMRAAAVPVVAVLAAVGAGGRKGEGQGTGRRGEVASGDDAAVAARLGPSSFGSSFPHSDFGIRFFLSPRVPLCGPFWSSPGAPPSWRCGRRRALLYSAAIFGPCQGRPGVVWVGRASERVFADARRFFYRRWIRQVDAARSAG